MSEEKSGFFTTMSDDNKVSVVAIICATLFCATCVNRCQTETEACHRVFLTPGLTAEQAQLAYRTCMDPVK